MANKIIAISDAHLGQTGKDAKGQYSLLSRRAPENRIASFARAVARYASDDPVSLVVVGDLLDLSLAFMEDALIDLRDLLAALWIDKLVVVPGNHDIKMWELHCEETNLMSALRRGRIPSSHADDPASKAMYRVTPTSGEPFTVLQHLVDNIYRPRHVPVTLAYPSYSIELADGQLVYFTHGHLSGKLYTALSTLLHDYLPPQAHDRMAATVNEPLISLIYWLLGEMGEGMGADGFLEKFYTDLQNGKAEEVRALVERCVATLLPNGFFAGVPDRWERGLAVKIVMKLIANRALHSLGSPSRDRHAEAQQTLAELWEWIKTVSPLKERVRDLSHATTLVTGHTHRPIYGYPYLGTKITAWNPGTWLIEPGHESPRTGFLGIDSAGATTWFDVV